WSAVGGPNWNLLSAATGETDPGSPRPRTCCSRTMDRIPLTGSPTAERRNESGATLRAAGALLPPTCRTAHERMLTVSGRARNHIAFYNNVGPASEGAYVSATRVVATAWGLGGVVYPDRIVWNRPGVRRPYAVWIRNPACRY